MQSKVLNLLWICSPTKRRPMFDPYQTEFFNVFDLSGKVPRLVVVMISSKVAAAKSKAEFEILDEVSKCERWRIRLRDTYNCANGFVSAVLSSWINGYPPPAHRIQASKWPDFMNWLATTSPLTEVENAHQRSTPDYWNAQAHCYPLQTALSTSNTAWESWTLLWLLRESFPEHTGIQQAASNRRCGERSGGACGAVKLQMNER